MKKFFKTPDQIYALMQQWFLSYHGENRGFFTGTEIFTFFDLSPEDVQRSIRQKANLDEREKPVLLLNCDNSDRKSVV